MIKRISIFGGVIYIIIGLIVVGALFGGPIALRLSQTTKTLTIKERWIKGVGDEPQIYLFSDLEGNVYSIQDEWSYLIFDASDRWAKTEVNGTYTVTLIGWRIHIFSWYQNAISIEEV